MKELPAPGEKPKPLGDKQLEDFLRQAQRVMVIHLKEALVKARSRLEHPQIRYRDIMYGVSVICAQLEKVTTLIRRMSPESDDIRAVLERQQILAEALDEIRRRGLLDGKPKSAGKKTVYQVASDNETDACLGQAVPEEIHAAPAPRKGANGWTSDMEES